MHIYSFFETIFLSSFGEKNLQLSFPFIPTSKLQSLVDFFIPSLYPFLSFIKGKDLRRLLPDVSWNFFWDNKYSVDLKAPWRVWNSYN